jgi:hypothetical protein
MMSLLSLRTVVPLVGLACAGCPGNLENPERFTDAAADAVTPADDAGDGGGCPDVPSDIFGKVCATAGCHNATDKSQGLDLQSPNVGTRLAGACARGGGYLIDPTNPRASVMYTKLTATPPFGGRMPTGQALDDTQLACVLAFISAQKGTLQNCDGGTPVTDAGPD